jgi:uncharacterized protein
MEQSILDHPVLTERYFFPRQQEFENTFWVENDNIKLSCYYHNPHPDSKTVIYFHGNGEIVPDYFDLFVPIFDKMGFNLFLAEYRGYGMSTGNPGLAAMLSDVKPIINAIGLPHEQLILFGRSIGSLYAIHGASICPDISGLIIESGVATILERVLLRIHPQELGIPMQLLELAVEKDFNHQDKLEKYKGKTLVMHAEHDSMVHNAHGLKLYEWAPEPKSLKLFPEGDHNDIFHVNAEEYFKLIHQFCT